MIRRADETSNLQPTMAPVHETGAHVNNVNGMRAFPR